MSTLTRERILQMPAGPEMDALVAELIGAEMFPSRRTFEARSFVGIEESEFRHRPYSTSDAAALEVLRATLQDGDAITIRYEGGNWKISRRNLNLGMEEVASGETLPLAICRAALLAKVQG